MKALVNAHLFEKLLKDLNLEMKLMIREILLFVLTYQVTPNKTCNLTEMLFRTKRTSEIQPMDHGVIKSVKSSYRNGLLQKTLVCINFCNRYNDLINISILDPLYWVI